MCHWRIDEKTGRNDPIARASISTCKIVANHAKIIERSMRELRTPGTLADCPHIRRSCLQTFVYLDVTSFVDFDAGRFQSDCRSVRYPSSRNKNIATGNLTLTKGCLDIDCDLGSRTSTHVLRKNLGRHHAAQFSHEYS